VISLIVTNLKPLGLELEFFAFKFKQPTRRIT